MQSISDRNVGITNKQVADRIAAEQWAYQQQMERAIARSNMQLGQAANYRAQNQANMQNLSNIGAGVGQFAGAYNQYQNNQRGSNNLTTGAKASNGKRTVSPANWDGFEAAPNAFNPPAIKPSPTDNWSGFQADPNAYNQYMDNVWDNQRMKFNPSLGADMNWNQFQIQPPSDYMNFQRMPGSYQTNPFSTQQLTPYQAPPSYDDLMRASGNRYRIRY
jgi:hypothetical protein